MMTAKTTIDTDAILNPENLQQLIAEAVEKA